MNVVLLEGHYQRMRQSSKDIMDETEDRRVITSAIDGMSVAEVRRSLATMRRSWEEASRSSSARPFYMTCSELVKGYTIQEFSYMFVRGHHAKRLNKNKSSSGAMARPGTPPAAVAAASA